MRLDEPQWWYGEEPDPRQRLLAPIGQFYGWFVARRLRRQQAYRAHLPVICIGNFTVGGTGKTPLSLFVAELLLARGEYPVFLTRGYGGNAPGPIWVDDAAADAAERFGDEPLLLARVAPTVVARDRKAGARLIEDGERPASIIIMDDGLQNPTLAKDLSIAVIDGKRGVGNGEIFPAGPLRAPLSFQLGLVDAIAVRAPRGANVDDLPIRTLMRREFTGPVLDCHAAPRGETDWLKEAPLVAFAGIANPERFFALLETLGANVVDRVAFGDHHPFTRDDCDRLIATAQEKGAHLVTTEKDWIRLKGTAAIGAELLKFTRPLAITMAFEDRDFDRLRSLIDTLTKKRN